MRILGGWGRDPICDVAYNLDESSLTTKLIAMRMVMVVVFEVVGTFQKYVNNLILKEVFEEIILQSFVTAANDYRDKFASQQSTYRLRTVVDFSLALFDDFLVNPAIRVLYGSRTGKPLLRLRLGLALQDHPDGLSGHFLTRLIRLIKVFSEE